jgi:hypothetical protein
MNLTIAEELAIFNAMKCTYDPGPPSAPVAMRKLCGWCKIVIQDGPVHAEVTHGICPDCRIRFQSGARS